MSANRELGNFGEDLAARQFAGHGWRVLDRNWRCRFGELDIVALDGRTLVFCEVKTRRSNRFGTAVEAVTPVKAQRLRRLAWAWLAVHRNGPESWDAVRIDVVAVTVRPAGDPDVTHLRAVA